MAPPKTLRIAILECDEPIGQTKEKYGSYGNLFYELLLAGLKHLASSEKPEVAGHELPELVVTKWDVVNSEMYPDLEKVDAVLLTGSRFNSFDNDPWILRLVSFAQTVLEQRRVRLIGVCFGHQIIGRAMGAKVDRGDKGWEVSVVEVQLTERGREILGLERLAIQQMHRDIVYSYPSGVEALGSTERCAVQGMYVHGRLITTQGHPEFNGEIVDELLRRRHEQGIFDDKMFDEGMSRVRRHHDGVVVAAAFIRFLLDE